MSDNNIKTAYILYTQDEVKAMMQACLKGINASNGITPAYNSFLYRILDDMQNQFSQILRILDVEYNEICKAVEAAEREANDESMETR